jgi:hypothetical protein
MHPTSPPSSPFSSTFIPVRRRWERLIGQVLASILFLFIPFGIVRYFILPNTQPTGAMAPPIAWLLIISCWLIFFLFISYHWSQFILDIGTRFSEQGIWRPTLAVPTFIPWPEIQQVDFFLGSFYLLTSSKTIVVRTIRFKQPESVRLLIENHISINTPLLYQDDNAIPKQCPNCHHNEFQMLIGRANRAIERRSYFGHGTLAERLMKLFFGVLFSTIPILGIAQLFPQSWQLYILVGWGIVVVATVLWIIIRHGLTGVTALRYQCINCRATWLRRAGKRWNMTFSGRMKS